MDIHLYNNIIWKDLCEIKTSTVFVHDFFLLKLGRLIRECVARNLLFVGLLMHFSNRSYVNWCTPFTDSELVYPFQWRFWSNLVEM